ncbi:MAG: hypothetical protein AB7V55_06505, partial [Oscillospiraceae bacterium]
MKKVWAAVRYPLLLVAVVGLSLLLFAGMYRWDNKYAPAVQPAGQGGVLRLDMAAYDEKPLLFLVRGWAYYHGQFLTPEQVAAAVPTDTVYIGQYAGFDRGDAAASPHGQGTWRLTIFCDGTERDYALELPEIYSAYHLWVNGVLKKVEGFAADGQYTPGTAHSMVTFSAADKIDIVVAVRDDTHFYSGMVYPPAFGSVQEVLELVSLRLLLHASACGIALVIALLCLFFGFRERRSAFPILALGCLCVIATTGYPLVHMLGLGGEGWYDIERMGTYTFLFAVIWMAGRLCGTKPAVYRTAMALAGAVALSIPMYRHWVLPNVQAAGSLYVYSSALGLWKWAVALYLFATIGWAVWRRHKHAAALLAGACVVATALVADRLFPRFEPVVTGWFGEVAAFIFVLVITGVLCADALRTYRENRQLEARAGLDALQLEGYRQQQAMQAVYVEETRRLTHDTKRSYLALRQQLEDGQLDALRAGLDAQLGALDVAHSQPITEHRLLNAILARFLQRAEAAGVPVACQVQVPAELRIDDADLARLCGNILDNALEAAQQVPA